MLWTRWLHSRLWYR